MKLLIYTNILSPYRKYFFDNLYEECIASGDEMKVFVMADTEPIRDWKYEMFKTEYTVLLKSRSYAIGHAYIHVNPDLKKSVKTYSPDVVICSGSYFCPGVWKLAKLKKSLGYKCFFWSESHLNESRNYSSIKFKIRDKIRHSIFSKMDGFWCAGEMSLAFIKKYNDSSKYIFVPNLIDENKFGEAYQVENNRIAEIKTAYNLPSNKRLLVMAARLSPEKAIDRFIDILSRCKNKEKACLVIAGDGPQKEYLQTYSLEKGVDVVFLGNKNQQEIIDLYSVGDYFVLSSISDCNPLSCIEALWSGLPLILSNNVGNHIEVVSNDQNGYVFDYENYEEAVRLVDEAIDASDEWLSKAHSFSRKRAEEKFCGKDNARRIISELKTINSCE